MLSIAKKSTFILVMTFISLSLSAQKKDLSDDQYFKSNWNNVIQQLPVVTKWVDDSHFILLKDSKKYTVDAATGIEKEIIDTSKIAEPSKTAAYNKDGE